MAGMLPAMAGNSAPMAAGAAAIADGKPARRRTFMETASILRTCPNFHRCGSFLAASYVLSKQLWVGSRTIENQFIPLEGIEQDPIILDVTIPLAFESPFERMIPVIRR